MFEARAGFREECFTTHQHFLLQRLTDKKQYIKKSLYDLITGLKPAWVLLLTGFCVRQMLGKAIGTHLSVHQAHTCAQMCKMSDIVCCTLVVQRINQLMCR
jgi:hypothetical protein